MITGLIIVGVVGFVGWIVYDIITYKESELDKVFHNPSNLLPWEQTPEQQQQAVKEDELDAEFGNTDFTHYEYLRKKD